MTGTFQALFVFLLALLAGARYTIAREHRGAAWPSADPTSRIIGVSAAFHTLFAPITYFSKGLCGSPGFGAVPQEGCRWRSLP